MMMPANFSAVSENEMTYVMGGASLAEYLCPIMETENWKKFSTNLVTIVGNKYLSGFLANTVGAMFSGAWVPGKGLSGFGKEFSNIWTNNYGQPTDTAGKIKGGLKGVANVGLNIIGNLAAIYNLGFGTVKNLASEKSFVESGNFKFTY